MLRSNGFSAHTALAIILVCVFNRSEQLPSWSSACLKKGDGLSVGIWLGRVFSLAEVFLRVGNYIFVKLLARQRNL